MNIKIEATLDAIQTNFPDNVSTGKIAYAVAIGNGTNNKKTTAKKIPIAIFPL